VDVGGAEVLLALDGALAGFARVEEVHRAHGEDDDGDDDAPGPAPAPLDVGPGPAGQDVEHDGGQRHKEVQPVGDLAGRGAGRQLRQAAQLDQGQAGHADDDADNEQDDAEADGDAVLAGPGGDEVAEAEHQKRHDQHHTDDDVDEEDADGERVDVVLAQGPLHQVDG